MTRHLLTVWDPTRDRDAIHAHARVLLDHLRAAREAGEEPDLTEVYVWWGKIRSNRRQQPLAHLPEILAIDDAIAPEGEGETHLYLTDYRSLYVAHLGGIVTEDPRETDPRYVPDYYKGDGVHCDCWFQLWDLRRLVHDDTEAVVAELRHLRNVRYHDQPVSLYGGMVDLPLVVTRADEAHFFDDAARERVLGSGRYWVQHDAEQAGVGAMERELRENVIGEHAWDALDPGTRTFVATAEKVFRDNRGNAAFDFAPVLGSLAKALEVETNRRLHRVLRIAKPSERTVTVDRQEVDLGARRMHLTLGQLARAMQEPHVATALYTCALNPQWFAQSLPAILEDLRKVRNPGTHEVAIDRPTAAKFRAQVLGIGCKGAMAELAAVRPRH